MRPNSTLAIVPDPLASKPAARSELRNQLNRLRGDPSRTPDASVVIPVNAQTDLETVLLLLGDLADYSGSHTLEILLVVNNYSSGNEPSEMARYQELGLQVLSHPDLQVAGEAPGFSARIPGVRAAASEQMLLFDADCRIENPSALIDWYLDQFRQGASVLYTHVAYRDYLQRWSVRSRFAIHHAARWIKRNALRIPTTRGSNYAVRRSLLLDLYDQGLLADDMNVGPVVKATGHRVAYSALRQLRVFTSGRRFTPGWLKLVPYFRYRFLYNLRVLPVRPDVASRTGREKDRDESRKTPTADR